MMIARKQVEERFGLSRSSIYRLMRDGRFPEPVRIGVRAVRWDEDEIAKWLANRRQRTAFAAPSSETRREGPTRRRRGVRRRRIAWTRSLRAAVLSGTRRPSAASPETCIGGPRRRRISAHSAAFGADPPNAPDPLAKGSTYPLIAALDWSSDQPRDHVLSSLCRIIAADPDPPPDALPRLRTAWRESSEAGSNRARLVIDGALDTLDTARRTRQPVTTVAEAAQWKGQPMVAMPEQLLDDGRWGELLQQPVN